MGENRTKVEYAQQAIEEMAIDAIYGLSHGQPARLDAHESSRGITAFASAGEFHPAGAPSGHRARIDRW